MSALFNTVLSCVLCYCVQRQCHAHFYCHCFIAQLSLCQAMKIVQHGDDVNDDSDDDVDDDVDDVDDDDDNDDYVVDDDDDDAG